MKTIEQILEWVEKELWNEYWDEYRNLHSGQNKYRFTLSYFAKKNPVIKKLSDLKNFITENKEEETHRGS